MKAGILFRFSSLWIGVHYSPYNKRFCINLVPCITIWITKKGGITPIKNIHPQRGITINKRS